MNWDHERVQELLAAHALGGLDAEDAGLAELALIEHVPRCEPCRTALEGFRMVAGELAWAAPAAAPPDTLEARLRRATAPSRPRGTRRAAWLSAGAAALLIAGLSGWNLTLANRLGEAETRQRFIVDVVSTLEDPDAGVVQMEEKVEGRMHLLFAPGERRMFLVASGMPAPDEGYYRVWLIGHGVRKDAGTFVPREGMALIRVERGAVTVREVVVTHEWATGGPTPAASPVAEATLGPG